MSMLEKCEGIPKGVQIIGMPDSIVHSDLSKTVCRVLQHIGANRIVPRHQQKKSHHTIVKGDKGQERLKIFKLN